MSSKLSGLESTLYTSTGHAESRRARSTEWEFAEATTPTPLLEHMKHARVRITHSTTRDV